MEPARPRTLRVVGSEEGSPYPKASMFLRGGARLFDCAAAFGLFAATGSAGWVVALLYLLFADGLLRGQSAGKRIFGVKVIYLPTHQSARYRDSVLRNSPFGLVMLMGMMPDLGDVAFAAGAVAIGAVEAWKVFRDEDGMRWGDFWAQTQVIDGKVVAGTGATASTASGRVMFEGTDAQRSPQAPQQRRG